MPVRIRSTDLGIIYAASSASSGNTYIDRKGVTQSFIELTSAYTQMTTTETGGVDTSKPFLDATVAMTLAVKATFNQVTAIKIKAQFRRPDQVAVSDAWFDIQTTNETSGITAVEHTLSGITSTTWTALQTASQATAGQIRVLAKYTAGYAPDEDDQFVVYCEAC